MRATLIIACAGLLLAAGAHAQEALKLCRQVKDDGERLKCYDGIDVSASNPAGPPADSKQAGAPWLITDEKSPLDDSPLVSAALASSDGRSHLLMRCKDRKTEAAISIRGFIKCGPDVRVIYRVDQSEATEIPWNAHSTCYLALAPSPIPFIRSLTDEGKIYVRMFDHHGAPHDALFNLGKVSEVRSRLAQACNWDGAANTGSDPAAKAPAPAPAAAPSPKGRAK
jgi:Type VI secretion system VasI, EvfG, VC_A0118